MSKPKLSTEKVINKSFIVWGETYNKNTIPVFLKWKLTDEDYNRITHLSTFVIVDYSKTKREWYVTYFNYEKVQSCTVDDISGTYSIASF